MRPAMILAFLPLLASSAGVLDRIAVIVGKEVITEREVLRQIRLAAFLNGEEFSYSPESRRTAAEQLVDQYLIRQDMQVGRYPQPETSEADKMLAEIVAQRFDRSEAAYRAALDKYGLSNRELRDFLLWQLAALRFTDFRFRPDIPPPSRALAQYLVRQSEQRAAELSDASNKNTSPNQVEPAPRAANAAAPAGAKTGNQAASKSVDAQLDEWLKEARKRTRIRFREEAFQ